MGCEFDGIVDELLDRVKAVNIEFQGKVISTLNLTPNSKDFENLKMAKGYIEDLKYIDRNTQNFLNNVKECIKKYKLLSENNLASKPPDTTTSNVMYNDSLVVSKTITFESVQMAIGNILVCYFLYHLYKNKV